MITLCLTFDDGLKDHHDIVAPLLEEHGWRGAFNVPTSLMDERERLKDRGWVRDICLEGHEDNLMTWVDVRDLIERGHDVYPHTCDHLNLLRLEEDGRIGEVRAQIENSKQQFVKHTGLIPDFFCSPHNKKSKIIERIVRKNGMELFECWRENFGEKIPYVYQGTITEFIKERADAGWMHVDIMIHGVDRAHGGWAPFVSKEEFAAFLDEITVMESNGLVKVVSYSASHHKPGTFTPLKKSIDRVVGKIRRCVFKCRKYL